MGDMHDADQVLLSFTLAWVCTIAYYSGFIPGSRFVKVPFACSHIHSLRTPEDDVTEDETKDLFDERHRSLYSWLSTRAIDELTGNEEKYVVVWLIADDGRGADDGPVRIAYVIEFTRCDEYGQNDDMIRKRTSSILKSVQVCCLNEELSGELRIEFDVWKGADRHGNVEELRKDRRVIEHGWFRIGYFEFRCWMVR